MQNVPPTVFDPYLSGGSIDDVHPDSHAATHGAACRRCGLPWPCGGSSSWEGRHFPSLIPNGAVVTTSEDMYRLINWAPRANCPVVLDTTGVAWILFATEDGDTYAGTSECPDDGTPARYEVDDLPAERGPLYVLFNGDYDALTQKGVQQ
ncbi:hypothetical protein [Kribbella sp. VKM Ac-2568]|uniref:hypothetical protein n=1 Tax=Kribbella sp. VKM Ac-2568 TaxID=2512219 RepID=UPI00105260A3|nr:hypothetical protein [Kribbella sp. VKM Ac-2568]TCM35124.1 hypothetical protein EV648_12517 [Kribbella sp. VKM Ac-2568]